MITTVDLKKINKRRIFRYIHYAKETSRQEIANKLDLSLPTVNQNLKNLLDSELIDFVGNFDSTGGRKAQTIVINDNAKFSISINIKKKELIAMVVNLKGIVTSTIKKRILFEANESYSQNIGLLVDEIISKNSLNTNDILGVGITIPGIFDKKGENILAAPTLHAYNFEVQLLQKYINYPSKVINDAKSGAYAEIWYNGNNFDVKKVQVEEVQQEESTEVYLLLDKGVGGAIIQGSNYLQGTHNRAGEFGHMTIVPGGRKCECGKLGCLEAYASTTRLTDDFDISLEEFFDGLSKNNRDYKIAFDNYIDNLSIGINNIYTVFDSHIVIGGNIAGYLEPYMDIIKDKLQVLNSFDANGNYLRLSEREQQEASIGAALMFLGEFIQNI